MVLGQVFERFAAESAISVMTRGAMQNAMAASALDALFEDVSERQYTRELLFSTLVDLVSVVVCDSRRSVNAAYMAAADRIPVSLTSVYNKLDGVEPAVSAELVRHTASRLGAVVEAMGGELPELLPGYRVKILDGNHFAASERRLKVLRGSKAGPLPGFAVVVLDPSLMLAIDVVTCEDGHAQERSLTDGMLATVSERDVVVADRNFCTSRLVFGIAERSGYFVIRQHAQNLSWEEAGTRWRCGRVEGGTAYEQRIEGSNEAGRVMALRRITVELDAPIRRGETELHIVTNLPADEISAIGVAALYRQRWTVEVMFHDLERTLNGEIKTLAYPKAAVFCFCVALAAYNVLSTVKAALRARHGHEKIEDEVSEYYVADEISGTYRGMMIALPEPEWQHFATMDPDRLGQVLVDLAGRVKLARLRRHARGPKKPTTKRTRYTTHTHVSTARLLAKSRGKDAP